MGELEDIYTAEWFAGDFSGLQPEFALVADSLIRQFRPASVIDVGCGPGMILGRMLEYGVGVIGYEGSRHGIAFARESIRTAIQHVDITALQKLPYADLVICTEVAEHLDEKHAAGLVELLSTAMCPVVFTAAPPGQDGHHHVNCQPQWWWLNLFHGRGMQLDVSATAMLKARWSRLERLAHMRSNVMVFT